MVRGSCHRGGTGAAHTFITHFPHLMVSELARVCGQSGSFSQAQGGECQSGPGRVDGQVGRSARHRGNRVRVCKDVLKFYTFSAYRYELI